MAEEPALAERRLIIAYLRHMVPLRNMVPKAAHEVRVLASDVEAGFHRDPALNPEAGEPLPAIMHVQLVPITLDEPASIEDAIAGALVTGGVENTGPATEAVMEVLKAHGHIIPGAPPARKILADAQAFAERTILAELAVRLFRVLILGNVVVAETPAAMDWLRDWIDGTLEGHGPIGHKMIWPDRIPFVVGLLRQWGFQPTPTLPPYVTRVPKVQGKPS